MDFQSIKDGPYCFLLTYKDDGTKFGDNAALTSKNAYAVALALLDMWATLGPPGILSCVTHLDIRHAPHTLAGHLDATTTQQA